MAEPLEIATHDSHSVHGSVYAVFFLCLAFLEQLKTLAIIRAEEVLPVPFGPVNKNACGNSPLLSMFCNCLRTSARCSCSMRCGRYVRYQDIINNSSANSLL